MRPTLSYGGRYGRGVSKVKEASDAIARLVKLGTGAVTVISDTPLAEDAVRAAVEEAGYEIADA